MKQFFLLAYGICLLAFSASAQSGLRFSCPGSQVVAYKLGTSCTAAQFKYYTISTGGVQSATPFFTLASTDKEVNGLGINSVDQYLYGIEYDRSPACGFSNFRLVRYDAAGGSVSVGSLPTIAGGTVQAALGCVSLQGDFIYSVNDASGNRYLARIESIASLSGSTATLTATYKKLVNNCVNASYADWAIDPASGKLYSYGIYNNAGVSTGIVVEINAQAGTISCIGTPNSTEFLDVARDNFGGVYFAGGGMLYGANVNTRKLYRINIATGDITYVSTMTGSGQMRADLGSCDNGTLVLPIRISNFRLRQQNNVLALSWNTGGDETAREFQVETSDGKGIFKVIGSITANRSDHYSFDAVLPATVTQYRIAAIANNGKVYYSEILTSSTQQQQLRPLANPVAGNTAQLQLPDALQGKHFVIMDAGGRSVRSGVTGAQQHWKLNVAGLQAGLYYLSVEHTSERVRFIVP